MNYHDDFQRHSSKTTIDDSVNAKIEAENPREHFEREGENFIPLRHRVLIQKLNQWLDFSTSQKHCFHRLCNALVAIFHVEHLAHLLQVEELYQTLDPDDETLETNPPSDVNSLDRNAEALLDRISGVLFTAHYHQLTSNDLEEAVRIGCQWGVKLDVNFDVFERLLVFARGYHLIKKKRRRWQNFYREETVELPEFHRLVIAFKVKHDKRMKDVFRPNVVYFKMFKNIPESDLEVLLPGSTVKLSLFDRGKILLPTISGAAITAYKIFRGVMLVTLATMTAIWNWVILIAVLSGYVIRSVFTYLSTRNKYQLGLTQSLYLKNLDNNMGVIYRLFNEAEEQELCETLLVYCIMWRHQTPISENELLEKTIEVLHTFTEQKVQFDIHDALGKLARIELATVDSRANWQAIPIEAAEAQLTLYWSQQLEKGNSLLKLQQLFSPDLP